MAQTADVIDLHGFATELHLFYLYYLNIQNCNLNFVYVWSFYYLTTTCSFFFPNIMRARNVRTMYIFCRNYIYWIYILLDILTFNACDGVGNSWIRFARNSTNDLTLKGIGRSAMLRQTELSSKCNGFIADAIDPAIGARCSDTRRAWHWLQGTREIFLCISCCSW